MTGIRFSSRYSTMASISEALISRIPERISDTAPARTPIASASPPLDFPVLSSARSISVASSMIHPLQIWRYTTIRSDNRNSSLTFLPNIRR